MANKYLLGFIVFVILSTSVYVMLPENVRIDVSKTTTTFKVYENNSWVVSGVETLSLYNGTKKMLANNRDITWIIEGNKTYISRTANYSNNVKLIDTYLFDGDVKNKELYPISHNITVINGDKLILQYDVSKLLYKGVTILNVQSPQSFGHNMKVEWEEGNYYSKILRLTNKTEGKLTIKYKINSNEYSKEMRLFDPETITITFTSPTPINNSIITDNFGYINVTTAGNTGSNMAAFIDFDRSLKAYYSMDRCNFTGCFDNSSYNRFASFTDSELNSSNLTAGYLGNAISITYNKSASKVGLLRVSSPNEPVNATNLEWTFSLWIYNDNTVTIGGETARPFKLFGYSGWGIINNAGTCQFNVDYYNYTGTRKNTQPVGGNCSFDTWTHFVGTYKLENSTSMNVSQYLNGVLTGTTLLMTNTTVSPSGLGATARNFEIGGDAGYPVYGYFKLNGMIDEFMVFNRSLSIVEIQAIYNNSQYRLEQNFTGLNDGTHNYTVYSYDNLNNYSTASQDFTVDINPPQINFESPTPNNNSYVSASTQTIVANITDSSNTSTWIDLDRSLLGYWSLDYYNSTHILDNSTYNTIGGYTGGLTTANITNGSRGTGIICNGTTGVTINNNAIFNLYNRSFSVSFWMNDTNVNAYQYIIAKGASGAPYRMFDFRITTTPARTLYFWMYVASGSESPSRTAAANVTLNNNTWYHVVGTYNYDTKVMSIYVDGAISGTGSIPDTLSSTSNLLFCSFSTSDKYEGVLDEVMIFNKTLTPLEVKALYHSGINKLNLTQTNLTNGSHQYTVYSIDYFGRYNQTTQNFIYDTCNYSGNGDWDLDCSKNCNITDLSVGSNNNLNVIGSGTTTISANIRGFKNIYTSGGSGICNINCYGGCFV